MNESARPKNLMIRNVRLPDGCAADVSITDGAFKSFEPAARNGADASSLDGAGRLMLPGLVEAHTHLDKTLWGMPWRPNSAGPRLIDYIENERSVRRSGFSGRSRRDLPVGIHQSGKRDCGIEPDP